MSGVPITSYKNRFPFALTVPSWLYPGDYLENVARVAPFVDGVELLFFEGREMSLPGRGTLDGLLALQKEHGLVYNIHMPMDDNLASTNPRERKEAVASHFRLMDLVKDFLPSTHTIHLERRVADHDAWVEASKESLHRLAQGCDPSSITVETLDTSLFPLADTIESLGFYICLDLGHLIHFGLPVEETIERFAPRCRMVHLHGVAGGKDHRSLAEMETAHIDRLLPFLLSYTHTLSVEIFKADPCFESIALLDSLLPR